MATKKDLTTSVLIEIRDQLKGVNGRLDSTNEHLDDLAGRIDRLEKRQTESEVRLATALIELRQSINDLPKALVGDLRKYIGPTLEDHEKRIAALEKKRA